MTAREEGRDDGEAWVFGGGGNEDDLTAFDGAQENILLSFGEAVNFIKEENGGGGRRLSKKRGLRAGGGGREELLQVGFFGSDSRKLFKGER